MLQIITANIGGHRNASQQTIDPAQVSADTQTILPLDPSQPALIGLQEVIRLTPSGSEGQQVDLAEQLAAGWGADFRAYFGLEADSQQHPHAVAWNKASFKGIPQASDGNSLVTNLPNGAWPWPTSAPGYPGHQEPAILNVSIGTPTLHSLGSRDSKPRCVIVGAFQSEYGPLYFMTTHLSTFKGEARKNADHPISKRASAERLLEIQHIIGLLDELRAAEAANGRPPAPVILAGDFNARPHTAEMRHLQTRFKLLLPEAFIFDFKEYTKSNLESDQLWTHLGHRVHIDHVLIDDPAQKLGTLRSCSIYQPPGIEQITDHFPILCVFD